MRRHCKVSILTQIHSRIQNQIHTRIQTQIHTRIKNQKSKKRRRKRFTPGYKIRFKQSKKFHLCDLRVHCTVHVVQQVKCFRDELIAILQDQSIYVYARIMDIMSKFVCSYLEETLLDLGLSSCVEVVGVSCPGQLENELEDLVLMEGLGTHLGLICLTMGYMLTMSSSVKLWTDLLSNWGKIKDIFQRCFKTFEAPGIPSTKSEHQSSGRKISEEWPC